MAIGRHPGHDPGAWLRYAGRRASVLAPAGSFAARRAGEVLSAAERTAAGFARLLGAPPAGPTPFDILLVDVVPAALGGEMPPDLTGLDLPPGAPPPLLRVVRPEGAAEPLAWPLTRLLVGERFGPRALAAETVLRGLAGLVAAGAESGPSRADADTWVQARLASRDRPMVLAAPAGAPEPAGARLAVRDGGSERLLELADG